MAVVFKNNAKTTLASSLTSSATSVTVADGSAFPSLSGGDTFFCTFDNGTNVEVVKVTARSSNTLTIVRAQDDTTARAFSTGAVAELRLTAGILNLFSQTGVAVTDEIEAYLDANGTTFPDNVKAQFGAGNDLQIYHDGSNSYISEVGTGSFYIQGQGNIYIQDDTGAETYARFQKNNAVKLFFDNDLKIATTSTGIDVTGTVTSDGLTVDGVGSLDNNGLNLELSSSNTGIIYDAQNGYHTFKRNGTNALQINGGNGDISFYEDTGTTAKLFWDASAESLGIGLTNPSEKLEVSGKIKASGQIRAGSYLESFPSFSFANDTDTGMFSDTANQLEFSTGGSSRLIIDSSGLIQAVSSITSDPTNTNAYFYNKSGVGPTLSGYQFSVRTGGTPSESLRVDNLGNFLVGTTSASVSGANTTGVVLSANAAAQFSRNGGHSLDINRTQAGELVRFRSAGAIVGTIGVINTNNLTIGGSVSNHSGLQFGTAVITPMRAGSESDAQIDIGFSNARFKDLYLSGTVNAGSIASSVTATTQSAGDNSTKVATTAYTDTAIANLADSAPSTLNTLNELAAALGDDANFSTTVTNSIATKLPLAGGTMTGALNMGSQNITNTGTISSGAITVTSTGAGTTASTFSGNYSASGDVKLAIFERSGGAVASAIEYNDATTDMEFGTTTSHNFSLKTADTRRLTITSAGNATFTGTIDSGDITSTGTVQVIGIKHSNGNEVIKLNDNVYTILRNPEGSNTLYMGDSGDRGNYYDNNHHNFRPFGGGTAWVRILSSGINVQSGGYQINGTTVIDLNRNLTNLGTISSGKIGVGANTASYWSQANSLVLDASGNTGLTIKSSTAGNGRLVFTDTTSSTAGLNDGGQIHYSHSDDSLNLRTAGANALTLDSSQNATFAGTISSGAITSTGALTLSVDTTDCINFSSNSTNNNRGISFNSRSALTADYNDGYLRLNNANEFSNGVYTLGNIRADGYVQTGAITINGTTIVDSSRNLSNIGTIASGAITTSGAMIQGYAAGTGEMFTWRNTTSGGKIQLGLQQNDTDGLHHRMYVRAYKGSATASGNVDLIVRGSGGATTTDVLELHSGQRAAWQGNDIFTDAYHPNADVLTTARTINGVSFNGSANITIADATKLALTGGTMTGNVIFSDSGTTKRGIQGQVGANDYWFFGGGATASNSGFVEIAAGDDGSTAGSYEPIYVRQYLGAPLTGTVQRTLTLLDNNGNTVIPNTLTVNSGFLKIAASSTDEGGELTLIRPTSGTTDINIDNFQNYLRVHASGGVWATIDSGGISSNSYQVGGTTVITSARALTNIGTINNTSYHQTSSTTPHHYIANGNTGTYNKTVTYINQNNTSGNTANGMFIEMGRLSDSSSAEVRHFVVGARGGQINFKVDGSGNTTATGSITSGAINTSGNVTLGTFGTTSTGTLILTGSSVNVQAELKCTNGNLHIDSEAGYATYINYYGGTGGIFFGNGASDYRGHINNSGHLNLGSAAASQSGYALSVGAVGVISTSRSIENINNVDATGRFKSTGQAAAGLYFTASGNHTDGLPHARLMESWGMSFTCNDARWSPNVTGGSFLVGLASGGTNHGTGNILATGNITAYYSDERLKTSLGNIKNALNKVQSLDGFRYINNDLAKSFGYDKEEPQLGLSAQQVQKIAPEVVTLAPFDMTGDGDINGDGKLYSKSGENYLTVDYARLVPLLVEAIKEQQKEIEYMKSEIKHLQENNNGD